jgi:type VI secretion system protein ImpM
VIGWLRSRAATTPVVGCYGKLPLDREFLRLNATHPEVEAVDRWIQGGMAAAHSRLDGRPEGEGRGVYGGWRGGDFVFPPPEKGQRYCIGHMHPSQDSAGRRFPCTLFLLAGARQAEPAFLVPLRYQAYLDGAAQVARSGEEMVDRTAWLERVRGLASLAEPREGAFPGDEGLGARLSRLLPDPEIYAPTLQLLIETVVDRPRGGWALRLPVVEEQGAVSGWLHLLDCLRPRDAAPHAAVWGDGVLFAVGGPPGAGVFLNLLGMTQDDRLVDGMDGETLAAASRRLATGIATALDAGGVPVSRLSGWRWR